SPRVEYGFGRTQSTRYGSVRWQRLCEASRAPSERSSTGATRRRSSARPCGSRSPGLPASTTTASARPGTASSRGRTNSQAVAAGVLVGVVADDRELRDGAVDAPVDAGEPGGDLVHRTVQIVDPALERDGEVDEIGLASAEQDELRGSDPAELPPGEHGEGRG